MQSLLRLDDRDPHLDGRLDLGHRLGALEANCRARPQTLRGQDSQVELFDAVDQRTGALLHVGVRNLFVGARDLDPLADLEQRRQRLHHRDRAQRGILVNDRDILGDGRQGHRFHPQGPRKGPAAERQHISKVVIEMKVDEAADNLREVIGPHRPGGELLAADIFGGQAQQLAVGEHPLLGLLQGETEGRGVGLQHERAGRRLLAGRDKAKSHGQVVNARADRHRQRRRCWCLRRRELWLREVASCGELHGLIGWSGSPAGPGRGTICT